MPEAVVSRICSSGTTKRNVASSLRLRAPGINSQKVKRFVGIQFGRFRYDVDRLSRARYRPGLTLWSEVASLSKCATFSRKAPNLPRRPQRKALGRSLNRRRSLKLRARNGSAIPTRTPRRKNGLANLARRALKTLGVENLEREPKNSRTLNLNNPLLLAILLRSCDVV